MEELEKERGVALDGVPVRREGMSKPNPAFSAHCLVNE